MEPGRPLVSLRLKTETVEDLVAQVARGDLRIPRLRHTRWTAEDDVALFDSLYRGFPVGSILLRRGPAEAARIQVGPLSIDAPEKEDALWVVDGQQRLTALAAGLVDFDAASRTFLSPPQDGWISSTWVPVTQLLDVSAFHKWIGQWPQAGDPDLRAAVSEAGHLIREYRIPLYIVETEDERALKEIFHRMNHQGRSLRWEDIRNGLLEPSRKPLTLQEMAEDLRALGMGAPARDQLLSCLAAVKGLDDSPAEELAGTAELLPAIRRALSFLKLHAEIPHLRLLPRSMPLTVLARFFALYREPKARSLTLLTRWTWRLLLTADFSDQKMLLRRSVTAIQAGDEERCVQELLSLVSKKSRTYVLPRRFEALSADSRLALLGLASLRPLDLKGGAPIDVPAHVEQQAADAFRRIFPDGQMLGASPANRILLAGSGTARRELIALSRLHGRESSVLLSHAISPCAADALLGGDAQTFLQERRDTVEEAVNHLGERLAAWSRNDRPSIRYLLELPEIEDEPDEANGETSEEDQEPPGALVDHNLPRLSLASSQLRLFVVREGGKLPSPDQGTCGDRKE